jgi:hypothetical protein
MVHGSWFMVHGSGCMVHGSWFMVQGSRFMVHGSGISTSTCSCSMPSSSSSSRCRLLPPSLLPSSSSSSSSKFAGTVVVVGVERFSADDVFGLDAFPGIFRVAEVDEARLPFLPCCQHKNAHFVDYEKMYYIVRTILLVRHYRVSWAAVSRRPLPQISGSVPVKSRVPRSPVSA